VVVLGQLVHRSRVPDPQMADYPDCMIVCEFRLVENQSTVRLPEHVLVALPGFLHRQLQPAAGFELGQVCRLELPAKPGGSSHLKTKYLADDIGNLNLPLYFTTRVTADSRTASVFPARPPGYFLEGTDAASLPAQPSSVQYPVSERAARDRAEVMRLDRESTEQLLAAKGGDWAAWHDSLQPFFDDLEAKSKANAGSLRRGRYLFQALRSGRYQRLVDDPTKGPIRMLSALNQQLRGRGIDLILVPFPFKEEVHAHYFSELAPKDGWYAPWRQKFLHALRGRDIEVIDVLPHFQQNAAGHPYVYYDATDRHPADGGLRIAAELIAQRLKRYELTTRTDHPAIVFQQRPVEVVIEPHNITRGGFPPNARYPGTQVVFPDGSLVPSDEESKSPIVVMGDSFTSVPGPGTPSANLVAHLGFHLGEVPCHLLTMGSSDQAMRVLAREGGSFLANRYALVFAFSPSRLQGSVSATESGGWDLYDLPPLRLR
jgi:SGNH hydrolase-like domain, acetyltransferase AlgX